MKISDYFKQFNTTSIAWVGAVAIVLAIIVNAYVGLENIKELAKVQGRLQNTGEIMLVIDSLHIDILNAESGQRGYLLSENADDLEPYIQALNQFSDSLKKVMAVESQNDEQQQRINAFAQVAQGKLNTLKASIELAVGLGSEVAQSKFERFNQEQMNIRHLYTAIIKQETKIRRGLIKRLDRAKANARNNVLWFTSLSILMCGAVLVLLIKHLDHIRRVKQKLEEYSVELESKVKNRTMELEQYADELNRSNRELEDFAFVASHDLQEPLRKIRAFGDRLTSGYSVELGEKGADYLARMNAAAQRMSVLISDLLELSRVTTRGRSFEEVDLYELLDKVIDDLEVAVQESNAQIELTSLPSIQADASQLSQLFSNLISNAIKFRRADQAPLIQIHGELVSPPEHLQSSDKPWIKITMTDNGIGFSPEYSDKIFTPFQRLHSRKEYAGTGIGLAVCRRIIERHSGQISAASPEQNGAIFTILLPTDADLFKVEDQKIELLTA